MVGYALRYIYTHKTCLSRIEEREIHLFLSPVNYPAIKRGASERAFTGIAKSQSRMPLLTHVYVYTYGHSYIHIYIRFIKNACTQRRRRRHKNPNINIPTRTRMQIYIYISADQLSRGISPSLSLTAAHVYI